MSNLFVHEGALRKRGEKWYFWAELEVGPDGKRRQVSRGGFKTRRAAEAAFANVSITLDRYAHVTAAMKQEIAAKVANLILD